MYSRLGRPIERGWVAAPGRAAGVNLVPRQVASAERHQVAGQAGELGQRFRQDDGAPAARPAGRDAPGDAANRIFVPGSVRVVLQHDPVAGLARAEVFERDGTLPNTIHGDDASKLGSL